MLAKNQEVIVSAEDVGQYLIMNPTNNVALVMNGTSHCIWQLCDGTRDVEAIVQQILHRQCPPSISVNARSQVEAAVRQHLTVLQRLRLIIETQVTSQQEEDVLQRCNLTESQEECRS